LSDVTGPSNGTELCGQMKLKKELFGSKHTDGFGVYRDKKYPMCTI